MTKKRPFPPKKNTGFPRDKRAPTGKARTDSPKKSGGARGKPADDRRQAPRPAAFKKPAIAEANPHLARLKGPVLWGYHAVEAAFNNPKRRIQRFVATAQGLQGFEATMEAAKAAGLKRPAPEIIDKDAFDRMLPPGAVHQGLAVMVEPLPVLDSADLINEAGTGPAIILILDQVTDPHNVGAILRSAAAFGAVGVVMQDRHAPELTGVLAKTACGGVDHVPVAQETNLSRAIEAFKEAGFTVLGLDERGQDVGRAPRNSKTVLVLGAEGAGLRRLVADHCDVLVSLPTHGAIKSLNVSNAAAVALYALRV